MARKKFDMSPATALLVVYNVALAIVLLTTSQTYKVSWSNPWIFVPPLLLGLSAWADYKK